MDSKFVYQLAVDGVFFVLTASDLRRIDSPFLTTLLDPESKFAQPEDGTFVIEADAACFSAFLHYSRFGVLAPCAAHNDYVLDQANFWGLREKISHELQLIKASKQKQK